MSTSLKALAADPAVDVKKTDLFRVEPHLLEEEPGFNVRNEGPALEDHIESMAQAVQGGATLPPLQVRVTDDRRIVIVDGHCRRRAILRAIERGAEIRYVDCVHFRGNDAERVAFMVSSSQGLALSPLETSFAYLRLSKFNWSNPEIARRVGKTAAHVEQLLVLANANHDVHELVRQGAVSASVAIDAVRKHGEQAGQFLRSHVDRAQAQGKSRVTNKAIRGWTPPRKTVSRVVDVVDRIVTIVPSETRAELEALRQDGGLTEGMKVEIEAGALLELLALQEEMAASRKSHAEKNGSGEEDPA